MVHKLFSNNAHQGWQPGLGSQTRAERAYCSLGVRVAVEKGDWLYKGD